MDSIASIFKDFQRDEVQLKTAYEFQAKVLEVIEEFKIRANMHPVVFKAFSKDRPKAEAAYRQTKEGKNIKSKAGYFIYLITH